MFGNYFYWQSIRRTVAVFGTLFNNIEVVRKDGSGKVLNISRVPLAYGPRQKFISRIEQASTYDTERIAIKLPRMSFEITNVSYEVANKMQKMHYEKFKSDEKDKSVKDYAIGPVFYNMGIELNIYAKNQDDGLQILEQILPFFQPQYTVTVKELKESTVSDYPFTLQSVNLEDNYEGDYETRRAIIYTLTFETKVRFYGDVRTHSLIKKADINWYADNAPDPFLRDSAIVIPFEANSDEAHDIIHLRTWMNQTLATVELDNIYNVEVGDPIVFTDELTVARIVSVDQNTNTIEVADLDGDIQVGETAYIPHKAQLSYTVVSFTTRWS